MGPGPLSDEGCGRLEQASGLMPAPTSQQALREETARFKAFLLRSGHESLVADRAAPCRGRGRTARARARRDSGLAAPGGNTPVRGIVIGVSSEELEVQSETGAVTVAITDETRVIRAVSGTVADLRRGQSRRARARRGIGPRHPSAHRPCRGRSSVMHPRPGPRLAVAAKRSAAWRRSGPSRPGRFESGTPTVAS